MELTKGIYEADNSDLRVQIFSIHHQDDIKVKAKARLSNKNNGYIYETKNYTFKKEQIKHWKKVFDK